MRSSFSRTTRDTPAVITFQVIYELLKYNAQYDHSFQHSRAHGLIYVPRWLLLSLIGRRNGNFYDSRHIEHYKLWFSFQFTFSTFALFLLFSIVNCQADFFISSRVASINNGRKHIDISFLYIFFRDFVQLKKNFCLSTHIIDISRVTW